MECNCDACEPGRLTEALAMKPERLTEAAVSAALDTLPGWAVDGAELVKEYRFPGYLDGIDFVRRLAVEAEAMDHHPDLRVGWRRVQVRLTTHSTGGLTMLDLELARRSDAAAVDRSAAPSTSPDADTSAPSSSRTAAPAEAGSWRDPRPGDSSGHL